MAKPFLIPRRTKIIAGAALVAMILGVFLASYQRVYLDSVSGRFRTEHMVGPVHWRTNHGESWITIYIDAPQEADWHFVGYRNQKLWTTYVNSKAGKVAHRLNHLNHLLNQYQFNNETRSLIANWIVDLLSREGSEVDVFVAAEYSFDRFNELFPFPEDSGGTLTTDEVAELISSSTVELEDIMNQP
ncbi:MAG: hypothetical protein ACX94C_09735 [Phycisphaerales bacterium]